LTTNHHLSTRYTAHLRRFRAAQDVLTTHGKGTTVPAPTELRAAGGAWTHAWTAARRLVRLGTPL